LIQFTTCLGVVNHTSDLYITSVVFIAYDKFTFQWHVERTQAGECDKYYMSLGDTCPSTHFISSHGAGHGAGL